MASVKNSTATKHSAVAGMSSLHDNHTQNHLKTAPEPDTILAPENVLATISSSIFTARASIAAAKMNPRATAFTPLAPPKNATSTIPPPPNASNRYELRTTDDRGLGVFATRSIPLGTLIICEQPLVRTPTKALAHVWVPYNDFSDENRATFDGLYLREYPFLPLEHMSRTYLVHHVDTLLPRGDLTSEIANHVRIMKIFASNAYQVPDDGLAVFATAARLNHSCVPNAQHSFNPALGSMTVHAVRDIHPNEEVTISYLGTEGTYAPSTERVNHLRAAYSFICHCSACSDATGRSDARRMFMGALATGLWQYMHGLITPSPFVPTDQNCALQNAEDHISCLIEEGIWTSELAKAYQVASTMAFNLGDLDRALEYARDEEVVQRNCLGIQMGSPGTTGVPTLTWLETVSRAVQERDGGTAHIREAVAKGGQSKEKQNKKWNKAQNGKVHGDEQEAIRIANEQ